jgi:DNA-binding MurR/RpiR family transcriptional regulator
VSSTPPDPPASTGDGPAASILLRVRAALPRLRPAERRVAEAVLQDPATVARSSIGALARACRTSETTVVRFCREIDVPGYAAFRLAIATDLGRRPHPDQPPPTGTITAEDTLADVVRTIGYTDARAIEDTTANIDLQALASAVDLVGAARHIDVVGIGASGFVAADLAQKLSRIGRRATAWVDPHAALTSAALLGPADVCIGISHTGDTVETVEVLAVAAAAGCRAVGITNASTSRLAERCDVVLTTVARETTFRSGAMASRIAQLALVDCLFVGVARLRPDDTDEALERTYAAVRGRSAADGPRRLA